MPVNPTGATGTSTAAAAAAATSATSTTAKLPADQFGQETFLKLLVAQLRYQDPMNPQNGAEFLSQTAQFTQLEKLSELSKMQTELVSAQRLIGASNLVGRTVTYPGPDGLDATGVVTAARLSADGPVLRVDDRDVPLATVREVRSTKTS